MMASSRIEGLVLTGLRQIADERGAVLHMLRCDAPEFERFGECYFSEVLPGAIKAWKRHRKQTQHIAVPVGRIRLVVYDGREFSSTVGNIQILELGRPDAYFRLQILPGLWYGFICISSVPALLVNCTDFPHDPNDGDQLPTNTHTIPYSWEDSSYLHADS